jgi:hypothetical protein
VPAALDDRIPIVPAQVGKAMGDHFVLDTGAWAGVIFPRFAAVHPNDVADEGGGRRMHDYDPFMKAVGVGGETRLQPTELKSFSVGGVYFTDWIVYMMPDNSAQEAEDYDGLIGYDFLRYFSLVFDYQNSMIYLEPNNLFRSNVTKS